MPLNQGQILQDRYRIVKLIGEGGFGAVYRAWDIGLDQPCALKENLDTTQEAQRQFKREAKILAGLRHPSLPRVTDHFVIPGQGQYLVMDFIEGEDLESMLEKQGPLSPEETLNWIEQVCDALLYLHNQKPPIIHRDIKPANIKIQPDGRAVLVDFGLVKVYDPQLKTTIGARAVTPGFSPPEQYGQERTDIRSDIYSLGATLYNLLTGQAPPDAIDRLVHNTELVPPSQLNQALSSGLERVILQATHVTTDRRFQSVDELRAALRQPPPEVVEAVAPASAPSAAPPPETPLSRPTKLLPETPADSPPSELKPRSTSAGERPIARQLSPWNPLHWLLLLWWALVRPKKLTAYKESLDKAGENRLRRTATVLTNTLTTLLLSPFIILIGIFWLLSTILALFSPDDPGKKGAEGRRATNIAGGVFSGSVSGVLAYFILFSIFGPYYILDSLIGAVTLAVLSVIVSVLTFRMTTIERGTRWGIAAGLLTVPGTIFLIYWEMEAYFVGVAIGIGVAIGMAGIKATGSKTMGVMNGLAAIIATVVVIIGPSIFFVIIVWLAVLIGVATGVERSIEKGKPTWLRLVIFGVLFLWFIVLLLIVTAPY